MSGDIFLRVAVSPKAKGFSRCPKHAWVVVWLSGWLLLSQARASVPEPDVVVSANGFHIVVNLPQTQLFLYDKGQLLRTWPVAVGTVLNKTLTGSFEVTGIYHNPIWHVPKSIQREMKARGKTVLSTVPPGPHSPIGKVFIGFGESGLGIHGTNVPSSVPGFRSHGCLRMKNPHVVELASFVSRGTPVTIAYQPVLLNRDANGALWLTVYRDRYLRNNISLPRLAKLLLNWQRDYHQAIENKRVDMALKQHLGKPVCLSCRQDKPSAVGLTVVRWLSQENTEMPSTSPPTVETPEAVEEELDPLLKVEPDTPDFPQPDEPDDMLQ